MGDKEDEYIFRYDEPNDIQGPNMLKQPNNTTSYSPELRKFDYSTKFTRSLEDTHKNYEDPMTRVEPQNKPFTLSTTENFKSTKGFDTASGNSKKLRRKKKKKTQNKRKPNKIDSRKKNTQKKHKSSKNKKKMHKSKKNRKGRGSRIASKKTIRADKRTIIDIPEQYSPFNEYIDVIDNLIDHHEELKNIYYKLKYSNTTSTEERNDTATMMYLITNKIIDCLVEIQTKLNNMDNTNKDNIILTFQEYHKNIYKYIKLNYIIDNESLINRIKTLGNTLLEYNIKD